MSNTAPLVDYGIATRAFDGAAESGDLYFVRTHPTGALLAVADGLGHGPGAARAASLAIATLADRPNTGVLRLVEDCHEALKGTRGAVLSVAAIDAVTQTMSWVSVGNVEALLIRMDAAGVCGREAVLQHGGIIGHRYPNPRAATLAIRPGDLLAFATDGIEGGFDREILPGKHPQLIADGILRRYGKASDDALILIARWNGSADRGGRGK